VHLLVIFYRIFIVHMLDYIIKNIYLDTYNLKEYIYYYINKLKYIIMENENDNDNENENDTQTIRQEHEQFIYHLNEIEKIHGVYDIEDMGNESPEQEYLMYIEDHCKELRELINKLYHTKLYIINTVKNNIELRRENIGD